MKGLFSFLTLRAPLDLTINCDILCTLFTVAKVSGWIVACRMRKNIKSMTDRERDKHANK